MIYIKIDEVTTYVSLSMGTSPTTERTLTRVGKFHYNEPNRLSYVHFAIMLDIKTTIIFKLYFWNTYMPFKPVESLFLIVRSILYKKNQMCIHDVLCNYISLSR